MRRTLILALALYATAPAIADDDPAFDVRLTPPRSIYRGSLDALAGMGMSLGSEAPTDPVPFFRVAAEVPLPFFNVEIENTPRLGVTAQFTKSPGDPESESGGPESLLAYRTLEFSIDLKQRIFQPIQSGDEWVILHARTTGGFMTRLPENIEARYDGPTFFSFGLEVQVKPHGAHLYVGVGPDGRLSGFYQPAVVVSGAVKAWKLAGFEAKLIVESVLGLQVRPQPSGEYGRRNLYAAYVALGR